MKTVTGTTLSEPEALPVVTTHAKAGSPLLPADSDSNNAAIIASSSMAITNKQQQKTRVRCGCSDYILKVMAIIAFSLFIIGIFVGGGLTRVTDVGAALSICFAIVFMIVWIVMLSLLFCMSCRYPVEEA